MRAVQKLSGANKNFAAGDLAGTCDKLASFISEVKKIVPASSANALIAEATAVRTSLGCG